MKFLKFSIIDIWFRIPFLFPDFEFHVLVLPYERLLPEVFERKADYFILTTTSEKNIHLTRALLYHFCDFFKTFDSSQVEVQINNAIKEYRDTSTSRARLVSLAMSTALFLNTPTLSFPKLQLQRNKNIRFLQLSSESDACISHFGVA